MGQGKQSGLYGLPLEPEQIEIQGARCRMSGLKGRLAYRTRGFAHGHGLRVRPLPAETMLGL
jgi:hypothetical protein